MLKRLDALYIVVGLTFAGVGLLLGEHMGRTGDHSQMPTHAHIMLAGWVFAALYGLIYRAWPTLMTGVLPRIQFALHVAGALSMTTALFFMFGGAGHDSPAIAFAAAGAISIIAGWLLFLIIFITRAGKNDVAPATRTQ